MTINRIQLKKTVLNHALYAFVLLLISISYNCRNIEPIDEINLENEEGAIKSFSFLMDNNPSLDKDYQLTLTDNVFKGVMPYETTIANLIPTFEYEGLEVLVENNIQESNYTANNFSKEVIYTVKAADNTSNEYQVRVSYFTGLPIFYINTNNVAIESKENTIPGKGSLYGGLNFEDLEENIMTIRGRGNSTWFLHPKKPYQLKFESKKEVLGMPKDKKWLFLAEYSDKTLLRNKITFEMGYISNLDWTPKSEFAEVYLNNVYNGTYNISQKVEESDNRVAIGDNGYLLEIDQLDRLDDDDVFFYTSNFLINIKEPDLDINSSEYNYVKTLVNDFETALFGPNFTDPTLGYNSFIDTPSFIDWYLINEINKNVDSRWYSSIFLNVIPGEKIKMGPLWDFDLSFGNVDYADAQFSEGFWVRQNQWYTRLFEDPNFVTQLKERFEFFRENESYILEKIDYYAQYLDLAQTENYKTWETLGTYVWPNPVYFDNYAEEVTHLKRWYIERMNWLETEFNKL